MEIKHDTSRRRLLKWSGAAAATVAVSGTWLPNFGISAALAADLGEGDVGILNYAYALEQLEAAFYTQVIDTPYEGITEDETTLLTDIREELSAEFGYTWTPAGEEDIRPERNGYGGESMLVQRSSAAWATNEPVQDYARKQEVMRVIDRVLARHGLWGLASLNDPSSGLDPSMLAKLYGSDDPRTQDTWEWYSDNYPDPLRFYATIYDLSNDPSGEFLAEREAQKAQTGEPLEGLQIFVYSRQLLSEADRDEFQKRIQDYPGF